LIDLKEIKNKTFKKENFYFLLIIFLIFFLDRYSKFEILRNFSDNSFYVNDFLNLYLIWNTGIGFGLLSFDTNLIYNLITTLIGLLIIILIMIGIKSESSEKIIFSIIVGGALGNFYDRIVFNAVPDFIDLHYGNFHWFTFNVADIFITIGVIAFLIKGFFLKKIE
tara:strand:+ start:760 stop:1257 length:498 start_codon:yes stop_codon:yes gene_type:complete